MRLVWLFFFVFCTAGHAEEPREPVEVIESYFHYFNQEDRTALMLLPVSHLFLLLGKADCLQPVW